MDFHVIHYTQIIWDEVAFIWKVTGKAVAIFMTSTVRFCHFGKTNSSKKWNEV